MLSKQITNLRKQSGMSQSQLAHYLSISPSTVGMYEQGRRVPDLATLRSMALLFGVSLDHLVIGGKTAQPQEAPSPGLNSPPHHNILCSSTSRLEEFTLITDLRVIGSRLHTSRKTQGLSQAEVAAAANISGRAYADIERGEANMRVDTMLRICQALHITPDAILIEERNPAVIRQQEMLQHLSNYSPEDIKKLYDLLHTIISLVDNNV